MQKREAQFTILFRHWLRANHMRSAVFELKQTTTKSIPFSDVKDHQIAGLQAAQNNSLLYKLSDQAQGIKPFDLVYLHHIPAYIVIKFPSCFVLIPLDNFLFEKNKSKRKSLTEERAKEIASVIV